MPGAWNLTPNPTSSKLRLVSQKAASMLNSSLKILVVEDHDAFRERLRETVESLGYGCRTARDGLEAWSMLRAEPADIVLSDWRMPRMDGTELCRRIRAADGEDAYTYFILLTGFCDRSHFLRAMEAGADGCYAKSVDPEEIRAHLLAARRTVEAYRRFHAENALLQRDSETAFRVARTDPLTQVSNRLLMSEDLEAEWLRAKRYGGACSVALCDIDEFKKYNDHFGHLSGDEALRCVAQAVRSSIRDSDGVYRYGGEEFVVLLTEQSLTQAARAMQRVLESIERLAIPSVSARRIVTISVGIGEFDPARDKTAESCLQRADAALYRAKKGGGNRIELDDSPRARNASDSA